MQGLWGSCEAVAVIAVFPFAQPAFNFPKQIVFLKNKSTTPMFYYVHVSGVDLQLDSFEELAMPLFDHLYNFAHWLTQNREEAEDLVQETYAKALKGPGEPVPTKACQGTKGSLRTLRYRYDRSVCLMGA